MSLLYIEISFLFLHLQIFPPIIFLKNKQKSCNFTAKQLPLSIFN